MVRPQGIVTLSNLVDMKKTLKTSLFVVMLTFVAIIGGCAKSQDSAGKVLDNAGSVIRSGAELPWLEPNPTPTP